MLSKELNLKLLKLLPEIKELYEDEVSWQEGDETGSHVVFADVFFPYIMEQLKQDNKETIQKIFECIEKILEIEDDYAEEVVSFSILENLSYEQIKQKDIMRYMEKRTKKIYRKFVEG